MSKRKIGQATIESLVDAMNTEMHHSIDCFICGEEEEEEGKTAIDFAAQLYKEGWRFINSEKFQTIGAACPECAALPDEERGE